MQSAWVLELIRFMLMDSYSLNGEDLQSLLLQNPKAGPVIRETGRLRKIRYEKKQESPS